MVLSMEQLLGALRREMHVEAHNIDPRQVITGFELLPPASEGDEGSLDPEKLWLCDFRDLRFRDRFWAPAPFLCVVGPGGEPDEVFFAHRSILVVWERSVARVMLCLANAMYDFGRESSYLTEFSRALLGCASVQELVDVGTGALENPVVVTDPGQRVIFHSPFSQEPNPRFEEIVRMEYLPVGHVGEADFPEQTQLFQNTGTGELPDVICKGLRVGSAPVGELHVLQFNRDFTSRDLQIADLLGNMLAVELWRRPEQWNPGREKRSERLIRDLLSDASLGRAETEQRLSETDWHPQTFLRAVIVRARSKEVMPKVSYQLMCRELGELLPGSTGLIFQNSVFLLLESSREISDMTQYLSPCRTTLREYHLVAGISNSFSELFRLREFGWQAQKAIQLGLSLRPDADLFCYRDFAAYYMMELGLKGADRENFCVPGLARLAEESRTGSDHLMETLRAYLHCGRSKAETARQLGVHVNTVRYRVEQIENRIGLSLDDDDHALDIMLSLRMMDFCDATRRDEWSEL